MPVAIATGGWLETITFRLNVAGIPFTSIPLVTSSDHYSRAEIIAASVRQAGRPLEEAICVGDGLWDFRAAMGDFAMGASRRRRGLNWQRRFEPS